MGNMLIVINTVLVLIGGLMYRIRGGLDMPFTDKHFPLNKLWWATYCTFVCWYLFGYDLTLLVTCWIACRMSTQIAGWSKYVVACTQGKLKDLFEIEVYTIDKIVNSLHITIKGKKIYLYEYPFLYGIIAMGMRGLLLTFIVGLCFHSVPYMLSGACLGLVYYCGGLIDRHIYPDGKGGWNWSEYLVGMVFTIFNLIWWKI